MSAFDLRFGFEACAWNVGKIERGVRVRYNCCVCVVGGRANGL